MGEDTRALIESATEDHITRELFEWLRSIPFYIGLLKGLYLQRQSNDGSIPIRNCYPPSCFQELRYRWAAYYGSLYIRLDLRETPNWYTSYSLGHDWMAFQVDSRREESLYRREFLLFLYTKIDNTIHKFLPGIIQINGFRPCSLCGDGRFNWCIPIGDKWLCEACMDRYSLPSPLEFEEYIKQDKEGSFASEQRAKMNPALRYSILERDGFKCVICGRSPLQGDDIKLEVDHIKPIFKGGLTEPDNLQVLCVECNRGKGVKTFWTDPNPQKKEVIKGKWFGDNL